MGCQKKTVLSIRRKDDAEKLCVCVNLEAVGMHPVWCERTFVASLPRLVVFQLSSTWPCRPRLWETPHTLRDLPTMWNARSHSDGWHDFHCTWLMKKWIWTVTKLPDMNGSHPLYAITFPHFFCRRLDGVWMVSGDDCRYHNGEGCQNSSLWCCVCHTLYRIQSWTCLYEQFLQCFIVSKFRFRLLCVFCLTMAVSLCFGCYFFAFSLVCCEVDC